MPVGRALDIPVDVVNVSSPTFRTFRGHLRKFEDGAYEVELFEETRDLREGSRVVINWRGGAARRVSAVVSKRFGDRLIAEESKRSPPEQRIWPRLTGGIPLRFRPLKVDEDPEAWLQGAEDDAPLDAWSVPDPLMNFSLSGLRFEDDQPHLQDEDLLLCELGVAARPERWRALLRVVRVVEIPEEIRDCEATHEIAVQFERLPLEAADALTEYTLRLQRLQF
ncbi:hypothetical protein KJ940_20085 [Myxococcota bacterium]|nr:hypothetical protein [Myxococcota bacterium]